MKSRFARGLSLLLAVLLLAGLLPAAALAAGDEEGVISAEVTVGSLYGRGGKTDDTCYYSDAWFLETSAAANSHLATLSAMTSVAADIGELLEALGFAGIRMNAYYADDIKLADSMGCIIGSKTLADGATLLAIIPRSTDYGTEWAGNLHVGGSGFHQGFQAARDEILRFLKSYIETEGVTGRVKIWATGFSRGAAVINLVGGFLAGDSGYFGGSVSIAPEDVFVYTFATPMGVTGGVTRAEVLCVAGAAAGTPDTDVPAFAYDGADAGDVIQPDDGRYGGIHNYIASGDYFAKLPPALWGFTRYGTTVDVEFGGEDMRAWLGLLSEEAAGMFAENGGYSTPLPLKAPDLRQQGLIETEEKLSTDDMITQHLNALASLAPTREAYVRQGYADVLGALTVLLSTNGAGFAHALAQTEPETLEKALLLNYLAYALEQQRKLDPALSDEAGLAAVVFELMDFLGLKVEDKANYTAQQLLKDVLDSVFQLAQAQSKTVEAMLPAEYVPFWQDLLALAQEIQPATLDDLIELIARFLVNPKHLLFTQDLLAPMAESMTAEDAALLRTLISGITQKTYDATPEGMKTALIDLVTGCAMGSGEKDAASFRASIRQLLGLSYRKQLTGQTALNALLTDSAAAPSAPVSFETMIRELVLDGLLEKDETGAPMSLTASADKALADFLRLIPAEGDAYGELLTSNPAAIRAIITAFLFAPQEDYSILRDAVNVLNFTERLPYLLPAHFPDLYISWLKAMDDNYVLPSKGEDAGRESAEAPADAVPFTDVPEDSYYADAVTWAYVTGVTTGTGDTTFSPEGSCTRGQVVTFLWRAAGKPEPASSENPFADVKESDYFYKAVLWAVEQGITKGTSETAFSPKQTCSSAHIITFLYRAMGIGADGWGAESANWAIEAGLTADTGLEINSKEDCPRAAVVTFLYRIYAAAEA